MVVPAMSSDNNDYCARKIPKLVPDVYIYLPRKHDAQFDEIIGYKALAKYAKPLFIWI